MNHSARIPHSASLHSSWVASRSTQSFLFIGDDGVYDGSPPSRSYDGAEIDAFVDDFVAPASLRDPFSNELIRRPVSVRRGAGPLEQEICIDESSLCWVLGEDELPNSSQESRDFHSGTRVTRHQRFCWQLDAFYDDAQQRADERLSAQNEHSTALSRYIDAARYELRQPHLPLWRQSDRTLEALILLERGGVLGMRLNQGLARLLPRVTDPQYSLMAIEQRRVRLLTDLRALHVHLRQTRQLLWDVLGPQAPLMPAYFEQWQNHYATLDCTALLLELALRVEIPTSFALRAQSQRIAAQRILGSQTNF